jgi:hypothetical protein
MDVVMDLGMVGVIVVVASGVFVPQGEGRLRKVDVV